MVLLNGIKYACERCIRGHRVSSCTHTDKPLVMIKPKGRPASQCGHCREQRKLKNVHTLCNCGKKGKSPGQHFASCLCHKNAHCTCSSKEKKPAAAKRKPDPVSPGSSLETPVSADSAKPVRAVEPASNILIEDLPVPFESGLLDYFQTLELPQSEYTDFPDEKLAERSSFPQQIRHLNNFPNPPTDAELDHMENMFPLFPLVGLTSFENDKSLPLLMLPEKVNGHTFNGYQNQQTQSSASQLQNQSHSSLHHSAAHSNASLPAQSQGPHHNSHQSALHAHQNAHQNSVSPHHHQSNTHTSASPANGTHHPHPMRPLASFSGLQSSRPRRPESVLSVASTSSNASKQNLLETPHISQVAFPKLLSSAAFPPFTYSENNSNDDFNPSALNSSGMFHDNRLLSLLSDDEGFKHFPPTGTPQSSLPSRQPLQTRRKSSLSRSHSQLLHTHKDHQLFSIKQATSVESSPHQMFGRKSPSIDPAHQQNRAVDTYLRELIEESVGALPEESDDMRRAEESLAESMHSFNQVSSSDALYNNPDYSMIPMYQELFEPLQSGAESL